MNEISFVLIGITGSGKSTFANTVLGKDDEFKESVNLESETSETIGKYGEFDGLKVFVVDTPGLEDSKERDTVQLAQMTKYIKSVSTVKAFIVVIEYGLRRFNEGHIRLFQLMKQMYPEKKWYHHIAIVWSNYSSDLSSRMKQMKEKKQKEILNQIKSKILTEITESELDAIPQYFLDSIEARENEGESRKQITDLLAWISQLEPLYKTCGTIQDVDKDIKEKKEETKIEKHDEIDGNVKKTISIEYRRIKNTLFSGHIFYSEWEEIPESRKTEKEEPLATIKEEERSREELLEERKVVDTKVDETGFWGKKTSTETGRTMQKKKIIKERRYVKILSDGKIEPISKWEIIDEKEEEEIINHFENKTEDSAGFFQNVLSATRTILPFL